MASISLWLVLTVRCPYWAGHASQRKASPDGMRSCADSKGCSSAPGTPALGSAGTLRAACGTARRTRDAVDRGSVFIQRRHGHDGDRLLGHRQRWDDVEHK